MFDSEEKRDQAVRINKFLSDSGVCSRREADTFVEQGKVLIDGEVAVMGSKVLPNQKVTFCGKLVERDEKMVLIALNKPQGIVCTTDKRDPDNIIDFLNYGKRIYPIGRLDKDSEGLILLTNNGDIVNKILRAGNNHEKEYIVTVNKTLTAEFLKGMSQGVPILDTVTRPCTIEAINKTTFRIILTQGLNRQIRRMCEYFDYKVINLQRVRIMNVNLGRLHLGGYRNLTDRELDELRELIEDSMSQPISNEIDEEMIDVRVSDKNINYKNTHTAAYKKKQYKGKNFAPSSQAGKEGKTGKTGKEGKTGNYRNSNENNKKSGTKERKFEDGRDSKVGYSRDSKVGYGRDSKLGYDKSNNGIDKKSGLARDSKPGYGKETKSGLARESKPGFGKETKTGYVKESKLGYGKETKSGFSKESKPGYGKETKTGFSKESKPGYGKETKTGLAKESKLGFGKETKSGIAKDRKSSYAKDGNIGKMSQNKSKEYGNAGQKTKNYRANRTSR